LLSMITEEIRFNPSYGPKVQKLTFSLLISLSV